MIPIYVFIIVLLLGFIYELLKQKEKFIPPHRLLNLQPLVPRSSARFTLYSNMCPQYDRTLTKFRVPVIGRCYRKL